MAYTLSREAFQQELHGQRTDLFTLRGAGGQRVAVSNQRRAPGAKWPCQTGRVGWWMWPWVTTPCRATLRGQPPWAPSLAVGQGACARAVACARWLHPQLPTNSGPTTTAGRRAAVFRCSGVTEVQPDAMVLTHTFRTEDDAVPGTVRLTLYLQVTPDNALHMDWMAEVADAATVFNPTGHAFFNLAGAGSTLGHTLQVPASRYVPLAPMWPTGTVDSVQGHAVRLFASRAAWLMPRPCRTSSWHGPVGWTTTWCWTMPPQSL